MTKKVANYTILFYKLKKICHMMFIHAFTVFVFVSMYVEPKIMFIFNAFLCVTNEFNRNVKICCRKNGETGRGNTTTTLSHRTCKRKPKAILKLISYNELKRQKKFFWLWSHKNSYLQF